MSVNTETIAPEVGMRCTEHSGSGAKGVKGAALLSNTGNNSPLGDKTQMLHIVLLQISGRRKSFLISKEWEVKNAFTLSPKGKDCESIIVTNN